jgi:hypothetical protein
MQILEKPGKGGAGDRRLVNQALIGEGLSKLNGGERRRR